MSIIYEALKKVQGKSDAAAAVPAKTGGGKALDATGVLKESTAVRTIILLLVFLALGMFLIEIVINRWFAARANTLPALVPEKIEPKEPVPSAEPSAAQPQPQPQLVLNGIVLSAEGNIALINDQILKAGDNIEGALVEEISADQVLLSYKAQKIALKAK